MGAATITLILPQIYRRPASRTGKHRRRSQSCRRNPPLPICRVKNREGFHGSDSPARDDRSSCRRPTPEKQGKPETRGSSLLRCLPEQRAESRCCCCIENARDGKEELAHVATANFARRNYRIVIWDLIEKESYEPFVVVDDMIDYSLLLEEMIFQVVALDLVMLS
nr:hypothetical protein Iba_chr14aCG27400 [Ipomoea batatas]